MAQALGRVVNVAALDECSEPRGRHAIEIPVEWVGAEVSISVPARLVCARCDGGGCDGCKRRGGFSVDGDDQARAVRVQLPLVMREAVVLRIIHPFGAAEGAIRQLHLEARVGVQASSGVVLCALAQRSPAAAMDPGPQRLPKSRHTGVVVAALFTLGILVALATMR